MSDPLNDDGHERSDSAHPGIREVAVTCARASVVGKKQLHTHARYGLAQRSRSGSSGQQAAGGWQQTKG